MSKFRKAKRARRHDEEWFNAHDSKWWRAARQACFWGSVGAMAVCTVAAAILIYQMPRQCDPPHAWYQGKVLLDVAPNVDERGFFSTLDLRGLRAKLEDYDRLGAQAVHLKGMNSERRDEGGEFLHRPSADFMSSYERVFGKRGGELVSELRELARAAHDRNMTLLAQVPVVPGEGDGQGRSVSVDLQHAVSKAVEFWGGVGADGVFLDGLERFDEEPDMAGRLRLWDLSLNGNSRQPSSSSSSSVSDSGGEAERKILMASYQMVRNLQDKSEREDGGKSFAEALNHLSLLDAKLDLDSSDVDGMNRLVSEAAAWDMEEGRPWINWNMRVSSGGKATATSLPLTNAHLAFQLFLPGTISIDAAASNVTGDSSGSSDDDVLGNLTRVRTLAVPIFMNGNYRRCECPDKPGGFEKELNFILRDASSSDKDGGEESRSRSSGKLVQMERFYSRRNRYILVANFGDSDAGLEAVGRMYSAGKLVVDTSGRHEEAETGGDGEDVVIKEMSLSPGNAYVFKLPK